jgi:hypothetical protein
MIPIRIYEVAMLRNSSRRARPAVMNRKVALVGTAWLICLLFLTAPTLVHAQAKVGTAGAQFLELGPSARAMGMAEAFAAVTNDVSAVYYNPAALINLYGMEVMGTYIKMPADINYGFFAAGFPLESVGGVLGFGVYALSTGEMVRTTYEQGTIDGTGETFVAEDLAVSASYGRYLTDKVSVGFTLRYIGEYFEKKTANGWSADVGLVYNTGYRGFKIATVITNFGPDLKFIEKDFPLPINFKFGASFDLIEGTDNLLTFCAEGTHPSDNLEKYNVGLEYTFKDRFVLRTGGRFNYDVDGFTAGGGIKVPFGEQSELRVDYAYQDFGILTQVHRFSMSLAF